VTNMLCITVLKVCYIRVLKFFFFFFFFFFIFYQSIEVIARKLKIGD
jgi:hypothetical protein